VRIARERRAPHPSPTATADAGLPPGGDASPGCAGPPHPHGATRSRQHAQAARRLGRSRAPRVAAPPAVAATARRARCQDRTGSSRGQGPPGSRRQLGPAAAATVLDDASTRLGPHPGTEPVLAAATAVVGLEGALHDGAPGSGRWHAAWPGARSPTSVRPVKSGTTRRTTATESRCGGVGAGYRCARSAGNRRCAAHTALPSHPPRTDRRLRARIPAVYGPRPSTGAGSPPIGSHVGEDPGAPDPVGPSPPRSASQHPCPQPVHRCG